jgi:Family of unknown function (DUF6220)
MAGTRRVTRSILRYLYPIYVLLIVLQVFFAGEGIFGARDTDSPIEDAKQLNLHRDFGFFIAQPGALLLLILALLAWFPNMRLRMLSIVLPVLLFVQAILPSAGRWVAALHPVNAFIILGMLGYLASVLWRGAAVTEEVPAAEAA